MKTGGQKGVYRHALETAGSAPGHCKKANIAIIESHEFFGPVHIKVIFTLCTVVC